MAAGSARWQPWSGCRRCGEAGSCGAASCGSGQPPAWCRCHPGYQAVSASRLIHMQTVAASLPLPAAEPWPSQCTFPGILCADVAACARLSGPGLLQAWNRAQDLWRRNVQDRRLLEEDVIAPLLARALHCYERLVERRCGAWHALPVLGVTCTLHGQGRAPPPPPLQCQPCDCASLVPVPWNCWCCQPPVTMLALDCASQIRRAGELSSQQDSQAQAVLLFRGQA